MQHKHDFKNFKNWITSPQLEKHDNPLFVFKIQATCDCGELGKRNATNEEVILYLNNLRCNYCNYFGEGQHIDQKYCFIALQNKIKQLELTIEDIKDEFRLIINKINY